MQCRRGPQPKRSFAFVEISDVFREELFCLDDPVRQNRICSFAVVIYYGSSIILNRLSFISKMLALKDERENISSASLVIVQHVSMKSLFLVFSPGHFPPLISHFTP